MTLQSGDSFNNSCTGINDTKPDNNNPAARGERNNTGTNCLWNSPNNLTFINAAYNNTKIIRNSSICGIVFLINAEPEKASQKSKPPQAANVAEKTLTASFFFPKRKNTPVKKI